MTRLEQARKGTITDDMRAVATAEGVAPESLVQAIAKGHAVIIRNTSRAIAPLGVGRGLSVKVNANIGSSDTSSGIEAEQAKLRAAVAAGADAVMDLSTGACISESRKRILDASPVVLGTVPLYEAMTKAVSGRACGPDPLSVSDDDMIDAIRAHLESGVDFVTVHVGLRQRHIPYLASRVMGVVSRGGSFLVAWMLAHRRENPLYQRFDEIVTIAKEHDAVLSLGDGLRPGATADSTDRAQLAELKTLAALALRARNAGVQAIIEGPGHIPLNQVAKNVRLQKRWCRGAPFYVLGPLVTDCAAGYDHIAGAIGGTLAAMAGADFLCYVTPREHLGLPEIEHVVDGVVASKIAAHAADLARGLPSAIKRDLEMSRARATLDWEGMFRTALAPQRARELLQKASVGEGCSMCGALCSARVNRETAQAYTGGWA